MVVALDTTLPGSLETAEVDQIATGAATRHPAPVGVTPPDGGVEFLASGADRA